MGDLPSSRPHHRKLPAELNHQIYLCFNSETQRKFIYALGWDFYVMFRHKLLTKIKRVCNPDQNNWNGTTTGAIDSTYGMTYRYFRTNIYAEKGFAISGKHSRADGFPGTIIYYYEVKKLWKSDLWVGFSNGIPKGERVGEYPNSFAMPTGYHCYLYRCAGEVHRFQLPDGAIYPPRKDNGRDVFGCGLLIDPNDKVAIFFTLNGTLICRQIPIGPLVDDHLFPTATLLICGPDDIETNFGNDKDRPFEYDIKKCPGMGLALN